MTAICGFSARRAWLFGQGNILAFPQTVMGIFQAVPDLVSSKSTKRERSYAVVDIVSGLGGIGRAFSNTVYVISFIHPVANFLLPYAAPISIVGSALSAIYAVGLYFNLRQANDMLNTLKADEEIPLNELFENYTDHDLSRIFNTDGKELKGRISKIVEKKSPEACRLTREAIEDRLEEVKKTFKFGIIVSIISVIAAVAFFMLVATPFAPIAIAITVAAFGLQIYNAGSDYNSRNDFDQALNLAEQINNLSE